MSGVAAIVLAAGGSSRLGRPKQLVVCQGESLLRRTVKAAIEGGCAPVVVVVGSAAERIAAEIADLAVITVPNNDWQRGLGTSIRAGLQALVAAERDAAAVVLLACDQPHVSGSVVAELVRRFRESRNAIVASRYAGTVGIPALFDRSLFAPLRELPDDCGAKHLIESSVAEITFVAFKEGAIDIDTPADFAALQTRAAAAPQS